MAINLKSRVRVGRPYTVLRSHQPTRCQAWRQSERRESILVSCLPSIFAIAAPQTRALIPVVSNSTIVQTRISWIYSMANSRSKRRHREPFAILAPHTLNVSQTVIRKKWEKLPVNWQQKVKQLIQSIGRPSHSGGGKHGNSTESQTAVENMLELYVQTSLHRFRRSTLTASTGWLGECPVCLSRRRLKNFASTSRPSYAVL